MSKSIEKLEKKLEELNELLTLNSGGNWGSQRKEFLTQQIKIFENLIYAYKKENFSDEIPLEKIKKELDQQFGFDEQKKKILEKIGFIEALKKNKISEEESTDFKLPTFCLVGPPGTGKTRFAQVLAEALNKPLLSLSLGGETKSSILIGTPPDSFRTELGRITEFIAKKKVKDPIVLLDEIDKTSLQDILSMILDRTQNHSIYDRCANIELDFSHINFIATANETENFSSSLLSRLVVTKIEPYTVEQKKKIFDLLIKKLFDNHKLDQSNLILTEEAVNFLVERIPEKGVRKLKVALEDYIFNYFLLEWTKIGKKIEINLDLLKKIIPHSFFEDEQEKKKETDLNKIEKKLKLIEKNLFEKLRNENKFSFFCFFLLVIIIMSIFLTLVRKNVKE